jgi:tRNA threonylcarbamoyladenosine biosynthesis protein TsaE
VSQLHLTLQSEAATLALAARLAGLLHGGMVVFLQGNLGAGKTTFCRGLIQALGHQGVVKSPTYTLVEPYQLADLQVYHFDLYRLHDPEELEFMGIRDYFNPNSLCLIEWPERGAGYLPQADLQLQLTQQGELRNVQLGAGSQAGSKIITILTDNEQI